MVESREAGWQPGGADEPLVTIAIPTFNRAGSYLPLCLECALGQSYENLEVFVSDNCSSDATTQVVAAREDPRVRYHRHESNIGPVKNWNFCIQQARGRYFLMLQDDDSIDSDFVRSCMAAAAANPQAGLIRSGTRMVDRFGNLMWESENPVTGSSFEDFVSAWLEERTAPFLCSTMFRTDAIQKHGFESRHYLWDDLVTELKVAAEYGCANVRGIKASYRTHPEELTYLAQIEEWCEESQDLLKLLESLSGARGAAVREQATPFLAMLNYRRALRMKKSWAERMVACRTVYRMMRSPPQAGLLLKETIKQSMVFNAIRSLRYGI